MKKICSLLLALCLTLSLSSCGNDNSTQDTDTGRFCVECGNELSATDKFCGSCGSSINEENNAEDIDNTTTEQDTPIYTTQAQKATTTKQNAPVYTTETQKVTTTEQDTPIYTTQAQKATTTKQAYTTKKATTTTTKRTTAAHTHSYSDATCTEPAKCSCGKVNGKALGHSYNNGVCSRCNAQDPNYVKTYSIGETWIVDGQWEFTVNSVTTHKLCNPYTNSGYGYTNEQVVIINYTYKNIGYTGTYQNLFMSSAVFDVYDEDGEAANGYACTHLKLAKDCDVGTKCTAEEDYVLLNNSSKITLLVSRYTSDSKFVKARFELPVN